MNELINDFQSRDGRLDRPSNAVKVSLIIIGLVVLAGLITLGKAMGVEINLTDVTHTF